MAASFAGATLWRHVRFSHGFINVFLEFAASGAGLGVASPLVANVVANEHLCALRD